MFERQIEFWEVPTMNAGLQPHFNKIMEKTLRRTQFSGLLVVNNARLERLVEDANMSLQESLQITERYSLLTVLFRDSILASFSKACRYAKERGYVVVYCKKLEIPDLWTNKYTFEFYDFKVEGPD